MSPLALRTLAPSLALAALGAGAALALTAAPAAAQGCPGAGACDAAALPAGDRLRIRTGDGRATYRLVGTAGDTLLVQRADAGAAERIPLASVQRLERSLGRHSRGRGFGRGLMIGGLSGLALGATIGVVASASDDTDAGDFIISDEAATGILALFGGASLGVLGGVIGAMAPGERWASVPVASRVSVQPMQGGLGVRVAF